MTDDENLTPCGDVSCILRDRARGGVGTNGGCQHLKARGPQLNALLRALGAEVVRLRRLPVIATCGECAWHRITHVFGDRVDYCGHPSAHNGDVDGDTAPPTWCPLRGGR